MADFQTIADATIDDLLALTPEDATSLGDHRFDDRVSDRNLARTEATVRQLRARQRELESVDQTQLDPESRVDAAMLANQLELEIFSAEEVRAPSWNPLVYNPGDGLFSLLGQQTQPAETRLRGVCGRLEAIPELVELAQRQLENPPRVHVETALQQHPGVVHLVREETDRLVANVSDLALRGRVARAQSRALAAWEAFGRHLEERLESAQGDFRLGEKRYAKKLRLALHSPLDPAEVLRRAQAHLDLLTEELAEASAELVGGGGTQQELIRRALDHVAEVRPDNNSVLGEAGAALGHLTSAVESSGLFTVPQDPYDLVVVPEFMRGMASAFCMPAGPFEEGAHSKVMIAPTPDEWTTERAQSFYREINSSMLVMLMAHEVMPGHVMQLAVARRFKGPTKVRAALGNGPFVEGWACHAERIVGELGLGGLPVRTQQIKVHIRSTMNAILDAAVHAGGMNEEEAIALMTERGYQERAEARGKWRRACLSSTQLSTYFVGYTELQDLFEQLAPITSYDEVLAHGSPPTSLLAGLLN
ncbi:MAG TPA: DUF885 domain-containing protein [Candidatus Dormibacteraeota bacterium]|nr:DUF885 domain-containing protein [Candidatus Dormibacteraeota bacterium]